MTPSAPWGSTTTRNYLPFCFRPNRIKDWVRGSATQRNGLDLFLDSTTRMFYVKQDCSQANTKKVPLLIWPFVEVTVGKGSPPPSNCPGHLLMYNISDPPMLLGITPPGHAAGWLFLRASHFWDSFKIHVQYCRVVHINTWLLHQEEFRLCNQQPLKVLLE